MSFSDFLENKLLDHVLRNTSYAPAASVWIALFTAAPTDAGGGTEVVGGAYARLEVGGASGRSFTAAAAGATSNNEAWQHPTATANWGTIVAVGIFDASVAGNLLSWGSLASSVVINSGDTFKFNAGDLDITLD